MQAKRELFISQGQAAPELEVGGEKEEMTEAEQRITKGHMANSVIWNMYEQVRSMWRVLILFIHIPLPRSQKVIWAHAPLASYLQKQNQVLLLLLLNWISFWIGFPIYLTRYKSAFKAEILNFSNKVKWKKGTSFYIWKTIINLWFQMIWC